MQRFLLLFFCASISLAGLQFAMADNHQPPAPPQPPGATPPPPPPPPPPAQQLKVFYSINGQVFGPFNKEQLIAKIAAREINRRTLVWMEGMTDWQAAATVAAVAPLLTAVPPEQKFDAAGYVVGTWESKAPGHFPDGTQFQASFSVTYRPDGSLTGFGQIVAQHQYGQFVANISMKGTWQVETKTDNSFILKTNGTTTMTTANQPPNTQTSNDAVLYTIIDRNTLASKDGTRSYRVSN
ncbi:MAG: DUF4339 domain-containing protein [Pseudomonadota bacterium]